MGAGEASTIRNNVCFHLEITCGLGWSYTGPARYTSFHQRCGWWWASAPRADTAFQQPGSNTTPTTTPCVHLIDICAAGRPHYSWEERGSKAGDTTSDLQSREKCWGWRKIPWLTFMNCSIALEASELERNKVFGSAVGAEQRRLYWPDLEENKTKLNNKFFLFFRKTLLDWAHNWC